MRARQREADEASLDILVPTYNRPLLLRRAIESVLAVEIEGLRLVIIDDGSEAWESDDGVLVSTPDVVAAFDDPRVHYTRLPKNAGLGEVFEVYKYLPGKSKYFTVLNDDDYFVDDEPVADAIAKLEADPEIAFVQISLTRQSDDLEISETIDLHHPRMSGQDFIRCYIDEEPIKHTTMYGIFRTAHIAATDALRSLRLEDQGLRDAFGIDTDFILRMATMGDVDFVNRPHVLRRETEGLTERYPVMFGYCYYQYILRGLAYLRERGQIAFEYEQRFVAYWLEVMLMMYSGSFDAPRARERGDENVRAHAGMGFHDYILGQARDFQFELNPRTQALFEVSQARKSQFEQPPGIVPQAAEQLSKRGGDVAEVDIWENERSVMRDTLGRLRQYVRRG